MPHLILLIAGLTVMVVGFLMRPESKEAGPHGETTSRLMFVVGLGIALLPIVTGQIA